MPCLNNGSCSNCTCNKCGDTDSIKYTGEYLPCTGIEEGDSLSVVLQKLDEKYCEIYSLLEECKNPTPDGHHGDAGCPSPLNDILTPWIPAPTTTSTTTTALNRIKLTPKNQVVGGTNYFGLFVERLSGVNPDTITFSPQIDRYATTNCTGGSSGFSSNATLNAGISSYFSGWGPADSSLSAKIVGLTVTGGNTITTSPQTITINGTSYVIEGFNSCTVL